jgi:ABC-type sugar transport system substrate-binding protein
MEPFWHGPSGDQTVQEQIQLIGDAVHSHAYGIVVRPGAFVAENRVLNQALAKGIPVVVLSEKIALSASSHLYYVLEDPHVTGRLIAERLKATIGKGEILVLGLEPDVPGSLDRSDAMESWLHAIAPDIHVMNKLLHAPHGSNHDQSVRQVIAAHPELRAIVALSAGEGLSAAAATSAAGARGRVRVIVCDQSIDLLLLLRSGMVDSIVVQQIRRMGAKAIDDIAADRSGRHPAQEVTFDPVMVTVENINSEPIQQMLLMHRSPPW